MSCFGIRVKIDGGLSPSTKSEMCKKCDYFSISL